MSIEVGGVTLPDIPSDVLEQYPYALIRKMEQGGQAGYDLMCSQEPFFVESGEATAGEEYAGLYFIDPLDMATNWVSYNLADNAWTLNFEITEQNTDQFVGPYTVDGVTYNLSIFWANYDIFVMENDGSGNYTPTDTIYFPSSVSHPTEYSIPHDDVVFLANKARAISGESGTLGFADIKASFDNLYSAEGVEFG